MLTEVFVSSLTDRASRCGRNATDRPPTPNQLHTTTEHRAPISSSAGLSSSSWYTPHNHTIHVSIPRPSFVHAFMDRIRPPSIPSSTDTRDSPHSFTHRPNPPQHNAKSTYIHPPPNHRHCHTCCLYSIATYTI